MRPSRKWPCASLSCSLIYSRASVSAASNCEFSTNSLALTKFESVAAPFEARSWPKHSNTHPGGGVLSSIAIKKVWFSIAAQKKLALKVRVEFPFPLPQYKYGRLVEARSLVLRHLASESRSCRSFQTSPSQNARADRSSNHSYHRKKRRSAAESRRSSQILWLRSRHADSLARQSIEA